LISALEHRIAIIIPGHLSNHLTIGNIRNPILVPYVAGF